LELRHRQRARVEDRIRAAKATGLANLPFDRWRRNAIWLELILAAQDLVCWAQVLLLDGPLARAEPKALRYRLWHVAARVGRCSAATAHPAPAQTRSTASGAPGWRGGISQGACLTFPGPTQTSQPPQ
jgi:Transposase DDE domain group 1